VRHRRNRAESPSYNSKIFHRKAREGEQSAVLQGVLSQAGWPGGHPDLCLPCPGDGFLRGYAARISLLESLAHFAQNVVVIRGLVLAHRFPVHSVWGGLSIGVFLQDLCVELFRITPFLLHEAHSSQAEKQLSCEFIFGEIAFDAVALLAIFVEDERGGRPHGVKAMEPCWILLDVNGERYVVLINE
jgi:hypothetical protein